MEWTSILVAALALVGTAIGSVAGIKASNQMVNFRLDKIERKVDKHNNFMERLATIEANCKTMCQDIDELKKVI